MHLKPSVPETGNDEWAWKGSVVGWERLTSKSVNFRECYYNATGRR